MSKANTEKKTGGDPSEVAAEMSTRQAPIKGSLADFLVDNPAVKDPGINLELQPEGKGALERQRQIESEHSDEDDEPIEGEEGEGKLKPKPVERKPVKGFTKRTIQSEKEARAELERTKQELADLRDKQVPELNGKIKELTEKANAATNQGEFDRIKGQLDEITKDRDKLKGDYEETQAALTFHDLQRKPEFQRDFVVPVQRSRESLNKVVAGNADLEGALDRAVSAHAAAMQSSKPEERTRHEAARDSIFREIYGHLHEMDRGKFDLAANRWMESTEHLTRALLDHRVTNQRYEEVRKKAAEDGKKQVREKWMNALDETGKSFKDYESLPDEEAAIAKELGEEFDITSDTELARKLIDPDENVSEQDATRLLNQGRVYKVVIAKNKVLEKRVADLTALLARYRGSSRLKSDSSTTILPDPPENREEGFSKFLKGFTPAGKQ